MELIYLSERGDSLNLWNNELFFFVGFDGMSELTASFSASNTGTMDGDIITAVHTQPRDITLNLRVKQPYDVEYVKREVCKIIKIKQKGVLHWTQNGRTWKIEGTVGEISMPRFTNKVIIQIPMHCSKPYWEDIEPTTSEITGVINAHYFTESPYDMLYFTSGGAPFGYLEMSRAKDFYNAGDVETGLTITLIALKTVTNPIITNQNGKFIGIGHGTGSLKVVLNAGDKVVITTEKGNKNIMLNDTTSLIDKLKPFSTYFQLETGDNTLSLNSDDVDIDNITFYAEYTQKYI